MFLKKSLLFMTALALLMFTGQASAQSVSLTSTSSEVSGQGTEIVVEVSQTGITQSVNAIEVVFDFDQSLLSLAAPTGWIKPSDDTVSLLSITAIPVPASASFTFTTSADVTGKEFSIGIKSVTLDAVTLTPSAVVAFNASGGPPAGGMSVSLTSDTVSGIVASQDIKVKVAVAGVTGTAGAEMVFAVNPAVATITKVEPATGLGVLERDGMRIVLGGIPTTLSDGHYATVTFTTNPDVLQTAFTIGVTKFEVFNTDGSRMAVGAGAPLQLSTAMTWLNVNDPPNEVIDGDHDKEYTAVLAYLNSIGCDGALGGAKVEIHARNFGAMVKGLRFPFEVDVENEGVVTPHVVQDSILVLQASGPATVRVKATNTAGDLQYTTPELVVTFVAPGPELRTEGPRFWHSNSSLLDNHSQADMSKAVDDPNRYPHESFPWVKYHEPDDNIKICTVGLSGQVTYDVDPVTPLKQVDHFWSESGNTLTLVPKQDDAVVLEVSATAGGKTTDTRIVRFYPQPAMSTSSDAATISPPAVSAAITGSAGVFIDLASVVLTHKVLAGNDKGVTVNSAPNTSKVNTLDFTVTATGAATVEVTITETLKWAAPQQDLVTVVRKTLVFSHERDPWLEANGDYPPDFVLEGKHESRYVAELAYRDSIGCDPALGNGRVVILARNFETEWNGGVEGVRFPFEVDVENEGLVTHRISQDSILTLEATGPATVRLSARNDGCANTDDGG